MSKNFIKIYSISRINNYVEHHHEKQTTQKNTINLSLSCVIFNIRLCNFWRQKNTFTWIICIIRCRVRFNNIRNDIFRKFFIDLVGRQAARSGPPRDTKFIFTFTRLLLVSSTSTIHSPFSNVTPRFTTNHEPTTLSSSTFSSLYHHPQQQHQHQYHQHLTNISPRSAPSIIDASLINFASHLLHSAHHHWYSVMHTTFLNILRKIRSSRTFALVSIARTLGVSTMKRLNN